MIQESPPETSSDVARLAGVLSQAEGVIMSTLGRLEEVREELGGLVEGRLQHPWSAEEFAQYLALTADERRAHRRYLAARGWYEAAFMQLRRTVENPSEPRSLRG